MDIETIRRRKAEIESEYGPWVAHNIKLADDLHTFPSARASNSTAARRFLQVVSDHFGGSLRGLRVLDLACLEGAYAVEFALHGAEVLGIEGRKINIAKAQFAKEVLDLRTLTFAQDDVRNLSVEKYGRFDVVLCCGLLYHLDAPSLFDFVEQIAAVCTRLLLLDTHVALRLAERTSHKGKSYAGWRYREFAAGTPDLQKLASPESSLDNEESFWLTRPSLWNLLAQVGFTSAHVSVNPAYPHGFLDRDTIVALKGPTIACQAVVEEPGPGVWPETEARLAQPSQAASLNASD